MIKTTILQVLQKDLYSESQRRCMVIPYLESKYKILSERFININYWNEYCGSEMIKFNLYDYSVLPVNRAPQAGDFIKINVKNGSEKYSATIWLSITAVDNKIARADEIEGYAISCLQVNSPYSPNARIFEDCIVSNFTISRGTDFIRASVYYHRIKNSISPGLISKFLNVFKIFSRKQIYPREELKCLTDGLVA